MRLLGFLAQMTILLNVETAIAADVLPATELYAKCYAKLTDHPVELNSADYIKVQQGSLDPITACMKVFNKAIFKVSGNTRTLASPADEVSRSILRNFHQFHLSWFTNNLNAGSIAAASFVDMNEPALYITDALFSKKHYSTVVTSQEPLSGIRSSAQPTLYYVNNSNLTDRDYMIGPMGVTGKALADDYYLVPKNDRLSLGALIGIKKAQPKVIPLPARFKGKTATLTDAEQAAHKLEVDEYDLTQHYGGGILGSVANFFSNTESRQPLDGGLKVHRRWANNNFYDLFCAKLPNLKETDAVVVNEFNQFKNSKLSFRQNKTCLSCHVTLDNFAHAARNVEARLLDTGAFRKAVNDAHPNLKTINLDFVYASPQTKPAAALVDIDPYYHRRPTTGRLVYRDFNGKLVNQAVTDLQDLGTKVSKQDDIYMCAAKRYYSFLTGIDVSMAPIPLDPSTKKPKASDQFDYYHRQIVVGLSKRLKTGGSLSTLIEDILKTQAFKARNPATVGN